jgi:very-short-patch-repair endonuclease
MIKQLARNLRKSPTDAERRLWRQIRMRNVSGNKFRRQQPVGKYIVDFICLEKRLIIEIDGGQHAVNVGRDLKREGWLQSQGFRILRFWNHEVMNEIESVLDAIELALNGPPPLPVASKSGNGNPASPPRGEEEQLKKPANDSLPPMGGRVGWGESINFTGR